MCDELVKRLRNLAGMIPHKHTLPSGADTVICSLEAFMQIKELAGEAAEELSKPRWIPVTERLPEKHQWCLVVGENLYDMDFINSRGVWTMHDKPYAPIDYWMPLPEGPK